jgi:hypothetical protein
MANVETNYKWRVASTVTVARIVNSAKNQTTVCLVTKLEPSEHYYLSHATFSLQCIVWLRCFTISYDGNISCPLFTCDSKKGRALH